VTLLERIDEVALGWAHNYRIQFGDFYLLIERNELAAINDFPPPKALADNALPHSLQLNILWTRSYSG
jgi:hypothetical protein